MGGGGEEEEEEEEDYIQDAEQKCSFSWKMPRSVAAAAYSAVGWERPIVTHNTDNLRTRAASALLFELSSMVDSAFPKQLPTTMLGTLLSKKQKS